MGFTKAGASPKGKFILHVCNNDRVNLVSHTGTNISAIGEMHVKQPGQNTLGKSKGNKTDTADLAVTAESENNNVRLDRPCLITGQWNNKAVCQGSGP